MKFPTDPLILVANNVMKFQTDGDEVFDGG